jgi:hypothetical protein
MHPVLKRNFEVFSACAWLAALTAHIPNAGEHLVRYDGWYSNVSRGKRRTAQGEGEAPDTIEEFSEIPASTAKRAWARLIKQVYEADPLVCPRCGEAMRLGNGSRRVTGESVPPRAREIKPSEPEGTGVRPAPIHGRSVPPHYCP